jgi:hypothetical protein
MTPEILLRVHKSSPVAHILNHTISVQNLIFSLSKVHLNTIVITTWKSAKWSLPNRFENPFPTPQRNHLSLDLHVQIGKLFTEMWNLRIYPYKCPNILVPVIILTRCYMCAYFFSYIDYNYPPKTSMLQDSPWKDDTYSSGQEISCS